jgi:hypothetical protein
MHGDDDPLVLDPNPGPLELGAVERGDESRGVLVMAVEGGVRARLAIAGRQQLDPVVARVRELL